MLKWYEEYGPQLHNNMVTSRIRLVRNRADYAFPGKLTENESNELVDGLIEGLKDVGSVMNEKFETCSPSNMPELERISLRERRILNSTATGKKFRTGLLLSEKEDISIVFNGDDHIRMQVVSPGQELEELWLKADKLDDYVNARFNYAFDDKYGYLTAFPTNVGTGMRANIIVHLPALSTGSKFPNLIAGMTRFGVTIHGVYGEGNENYGALYDISNSKTLGVSEKEIIDMVIRVASQLNSQEHQVRQMSLKNHKLQRKDEIFKSYGVLRYARRLSLKDGLTFLSQLMSGLSDELIHTKERCSIYELMLGIQPASLMCKADHPLGREEIEVARAEYIRGKLSEITE